jgi:hypothetical protein
MTCAGLGQTGARRSSSRASYWARECEDESVVYAALINAMSTDTDDVIAGVQDVCLSG